MIKTANAVYTGGNIWLFFGELDDGTCYLVDDNGSVRITDAPWDDFDRTLFDEWQDEHLVRDIEDEDERIEFCDELCDKLHAIGKLNGLTHEEIDAYRKWFREPL